MTPPVILVHGGLGDDMDADRFWFRPASSGAFEPQGSSLLPDRDTTPSSWAAAADALAMTLGTSTSVVAGSNGVSVALRLALQHRPLVDRLLLLWPATCGDPVVDAGAPPRAWHLLAGDTLRGVTDDELRGLAVSVVVMGSEPPNRIHAQYTVDRLIELVPPATRIQTGFPESPLPHFEAVRDEFIATIVPFLR